MVPNLNATEAAATSNQHYIRLALGDETPPLSPSLLKEDPLSSSAVRPTELENRASTEIAELQAIKTQHEPSCQSVFSPEALRPYPKAPPGKIIKRGRKIKKSAIYTDSPEKEGVRKEYEERQKRLKNTQTKKKILQISIEKTNKGNEKAKKKKTPPESSEEE
ncbi:hypothetical protein EVAR_33800_1 [Eumeta japonica]|uniref:Uncharacterized protein n=1 Tax=Eumeta variegata TaxID=151549 RepID=A0A4C1VS77_EUMVA|nr:hypothetical protein EVAR_33800_1 [Eumeta japonica]